jgi:predicted lactoylglutathione lyase
MSIQVSKVFLNLKVQDLSRARSFFTRLGITIEEAFLNESEK